MRNQKIKNMLTMVGADDSQSTIAMIDSLIHFIPTQYLRNFTEYVLKNYDKYKKPIVNITTSSQEYKKQLKLAMIRKGEFKLKDVQETKAFLLEFFKGQEIANNVKGLYSPFVTISLTDDREFLNGYSFNKLNSSDVADFLTWCFLNQQQIGIIEIIETDNAKDMMISYQNSFEKVEEKEDDTICVEVLNVIKKRTI